MDPAPVQRGLERDDRIPVASVYPASVSGALCLPRALMDFRASSSPYRFAGLKGPWKFTGFEDAGSDRFAISITGPPSQPLAGIPILDFLMSGRGRSIRPHAIGVAAHQLCHITRAFLLANATAATLGPPLSLSRLSQILRRRVCARPGGWPRVPRG
jgi:hypothetical protein